MKSFRSGGPALVVWGNLATFLLLSSTFSFAGTLSAWPQRYAVSQDAAAGRLILTTPYYRVEHDLRRGGEIALIRLTHGQAPNLLLQPIETQLRDEHDVTYSDVRDSQPTVDHHEDGPLEIVTVRARLLDESGHPLSGALQTMFEYHWGFIKIRREFTGVPESFRAREVCLLDATLSPSLTDYGYRPGTSEENGAARFDFGVNHWGKLREASDPTVQTQVLPRSVLLANPGVEGLEWFEGSDLAPWETRLAGQRGQGSFTLQHQPGKAGLHLRVAPFLGTNSGVPLPTSCVFQCYIGLPLLEGHALRPWLHESFNRNRGQWVSTAQIQEWAENGVQTLHCHNDGDAYGDGLFWRDGSYPPYPDMDQYDRVIADSHRFGLHVATYFSNKELHPSTAEFQMHSREWGRMDRASTLQHNVFRGTNEFGAQMCLRSGWLDFLKFSVDRVLKHHALDGVYYDWNVALFCENPLHEGKPAGAVADGHWDIDELLDFMEWTRRRVGPDGLIIVHDTQTPMFATENFADDVVANEWGNGRWSKEGPTLEQLPLEWSLVNARSRGVISYGQLDDKSPRHLFRLFALEALLSGVTPWPASAETFQLYPILKPVGDLANDRFNDWRHPAVTLNDPHCASAAYSRPGEADILIGNLKQDAVQVSCTLHPEKLPHPLAEVLAATISKPGSATAAPCDLQALLGAGVALQIPAESAVLLHLTERAAEQAPTGPKRP